MIEMFMPFDNEINMQNYIHNLESSKQEITQDIDNPSVITQLLLLSQAYTFFDDLKKYYYHMELSNEQIENFVLALDDLIDEFEDVQNMTSANQLKKDYYEKADSFYTLLVNLQTELGFYLSDRKYGV
ncbi:hypothetical protein GSY74_03155 [Sulfurovum sp. bin170]|uniref:hypothetical protein n=1 Tax=Sulfurovum sp. bin170 TaxID=2695268 RepID=UPI0013DEAC00|nr:hypothetical protein [Sulfurovum sp. bin170]NEW60271.1 hypothetical protein [Sulfurovum sp. bin170]